MAYFIIENGILIAYRGNDSNVVIPKGVTSIRRGAFCGCRRLTSIVIPKGVTSIECAAFYGCSGLISITIPDSVTTIESGAFAGCISLTSINYEGIMVRWYDIAGWDEGITVHCTDGDIAKEI